MQTKKDCLGLLWKPTRRITIVVNNKWRWLSFKSHMSYTLRAHAPDTRIINYLQNLNCTAYVDPSIYIFYQKALLYSAFRKWHQTKWRSSLLSHLNGLTGFKDNFFYQHRLFGISSEYVRVCVTSLFNWFATIIFLDR